MFKDLLCYVYIKGWKYSMIIQLLLRILYKSEGDENINLFMRINCNVC